MGEPIRTACVQEVHRDGQQRGFEGQQTQAGAPVRGAVVAMALCSEAGGDQGQQQHACELDFRVEDLGEDQGATVEGQAVIYIYLYM